MTKPSTAMFFNKAKFALSKHSPEILTGIGIAGMITSTVFAVKATPKALRLIEERKRELDVEKLTPGETIKTAWKCYIPSAVITTASMGCIIGASSIHLRRNAALAAAYKISETALTEYKAKVVETIGEKKEQAIREQIDKDHVEQNPVSKSEVIMTGTGDFLCMDYYSKRYFRSSRNHLEKVVNKLNRHMLNNEYVSLNDFYDEIGLSHMPVGYDIGWRIDRGYFDLDLGTQMADNDEPCIVVNFTKAPDYGYSSFS